MKITFTLIFLLILTPMLCFCSETEAVFKQLDSYTDKLKPQLNKIYQASGFQRFPCEDVYIRIFKYEEQLEVWGEEDGNWRLIHTYDAYNLPLNNINFKSKTLLDLIPGIENQEINTENIGPKEKMGDSKVPEGFYRILYHNPWSSFHLSLAVSYPNPSDAIRGFKNSVIQESGRDKIINWYNRNLKEIKENCISGAPAIWYDSDAKPLGNQIFIHGSYVTIGCIPIGDDKIEEVFVITDPRTVGGTRVDIFPCRYTDLNLEKLKRIKDHDNNLYRFWMDLRKGYDYFEEKKQIPEIFAEPQTGRYIIHPDKNKRAGLIEI